MTEKLSRAERVQIADPRICPACGARGHRIQTRQEVNGVHRRRECVSKECRWRWTTIEIDLDRAQAVVALERAFYSVWEVLKSTSPDMTFRRKLRGKSTGASHKVVHMHDDQWWFWDETWGKRTGPFGSEAEAINAWTVYIDEILPYEQSTEEAST